LLDRRHPLPVPIAVSSAAFKRLENLLITIISRSDCSISGSGSEFLGLASQRASGVLGKTKARMQAFRALSTGALAFSGSPQYDSFLFLLDIILFTSLKPFQAVSLVGAVFRVCVALQRRGTVGGARHRARSNFLVSAIQRSTGHLFGSVAVDAG
jgi:hypothetical protein